MATRDMMTLVGSAVVVPLVITPIVVATSTKMMDLAIVRENIHRLKAASIESRNNSELENKLIKTSRAESIVSIVRKTLRGWPVNLSRAKRLKILSCRDSKIVL